MDSNVVADTNRAMDLQPKTQLNGTVLKIRLAGAVIDIGTGKPAVLHVSQIVAADNKPFKSVTEVLIEGQKIEVWVKKVVRKDDEERVELTMLRPLDLDWRDIKVGNQVKGKIVRLEKFGAFVEIGAERPGLIHISEIAHGYIKTPSEVIHEGDEVEVKILEVNRRKKQIKLSMKALQELPVVEEKPKETPRVEMNFERPAQKPKKAPRRQKRNEGSNFSVEMAELNSEVDKEPTAMEIAIREAMERVKGNRKQSDEEKERKSKAISLEQEEILTRTLGKKINS